MGGKDIIEFVRVLLKNFDILIDDNLTLRTYHGCESIYFHNLSTDEELIGKEYLSFNYQCSKCYEERNIYFFFRLAVIGHCKLQEGNLVRLTS